MKKLLSVITLTLLFMTSFAQLTAIPEKEIPETYGYIVEIGQAMPDIQMELADGTKISKQDMLGKIVMLQFTASWCSVCREEMPFIEKDIWEKHKNNPDFMLIGVDMNEPVEKVKKFAADMKITYPLALDPGAEIFYKFAAKGAGVTRNVIIDKNGKIVYLTRLYEKEEFNEMVEVIGFLLNK